MADRKGFLIDESNHNTEGPMVFEMGKGFDPRPDPRSSFRLENDLLTGVLKIVSDPIDALERKAA